MYEFAQEKYIFANKRAKTEGRQDIWRLISKKWVSSLKEEA